jgi:hypothetical protein
VKELAKNFPNRFRIQETHFSRQGTLIIKLKWKLFLAHNR